MDSHYLHHLLALAVQTGDRLIVIDPTTERPFVLMDLPQYTALTEGAAHPVTPPANVSPSVATVNEDIAAWRSSAVVHGETVSLEQAGHETRATVASQPAVYAAPTVSAAPAVFAPEPLQSAAVDDDRFYVEPLE